MMDRFFEQTECDRCGGSLRIRTMSWFTTETICGNCAHKEGELKKQLRAAGVDVAALEGCGYIPEAPKEAGHDA